MVLIDGKSAQRPDAAAAGSSAPSGGQPAAGAEPAAPTILVPAMGAVPAMAAVQTIAVPATAMGAVPAPPPLSPYGFPSVSVGPPAAVPMGAMPPPLPGMPMPSMASMPGIGAMGGVPGMGALPSPASGNFDLFAHMAAAARMQAAMAQSEDPEADAKKQKAKEEDAPAAFDKDALMRLAKQAEDTADAPGAAVGGQQPQQPPLPPPPPLEAPGTSSAPLQAPPPHFAAAQGPHQLMDAPHVVMQPVAGEASDTAPPKRSAPAGGIEPSAKKPLLWTDPDSMKEVAVLPAVAEAESAKKDDTSVATLLQQVQVNVARGRATGGRGGSAAELAREAVQQAFASGAAPGGPGGLGSATGSAGARFSGNASAMYDSLAHRLQGDLSSPEARRLLEQEALELLPRLEPPRAAELLSRLQAADAIRTASFLEGLLQTLAPVVSRFNSPHLTRVLVTVASWALATSACDADGKPKLPDKVREFFTVVSAELSLRLMDIVPRDLSLIATALASVGLGDTRLFSSLARAAVARSERFLPQEMVALAGAFDKVAMLHTTLFEALARCLRSNIRDIPAQDLMKGAICLANGQIRDEELGITIGEQLPKRVAQGTLSTDDFCSMALSFCSLGIYHDQLFRSVFRVMEDIAKISGATLCNLYEIHLALKAFRYDQYRSFELPGKTVKALQDHYRRHWSGRLRDQRPERAAEKVHREVAETLREVVGGTVQRQHLTTSGLSADIAAVRRKRSKAEVLLEIDGPHSTFYPLEVTTSNAQSPAGRIRGDVMLKRRLLQQQGFRVAVLSEEVWRSLDDSRDKRDFIRELVRAAGLVESKLV